MSKDIEQKDKELKAVTPKFIFGKQNYILIIVAVAVIALGYILMSGREDIYSTMKITIAPIVVLLGFVIGIYAILKKPSESPEA